jgi:hypothetical protein
MRLGEFVARHPAVRLATAADNASILDFFEDSPMQTSAFNVQYRRRPDFFRLLGYQADRAHVLIGEDGGRINAVGTVSLRPGWVNGRSTTVGYLGDLRVRFDRTVVPRWRRLFGDLLAHAAEIDELADCTHWFTAVMDDNRLARTALGARRPGMPSLVPVGPFMMRNLLLRVPFAGTVRSTSGWNVVRATARDRDRLVTFFEEENRRLPLGFRGEFERRLAQWKGLAITDFVYAVEREGIVACVAPWSPSAAKQTLISRVPIGLRVLGRAAAALRSARIRIPQAGEPLRIAYLTHLTFADRLAAHERPLVFRAMLDALCVTWRETDWHCLAVCDFNTWGLGRALRGFIQETVPITVYEVVPPGRPHPSATSLCGVSPPAFEMALV